MNQLAYPDPNGNLRKNLAALSKLRPELYRLITGQERGPVGELHRAPDGNFNLRYTSSRYPARELWAYPPSGPSAAVDHCLSRVDEAGDALLVFIGFALGYEALSVFENRPRISHMVIIEPSLDQFFLSLHLLDFSDFFASSRVDVFLGPVDMEAVSEAIRDEAMIRDTQIFHHVPSLEWQPGIYEPVDQAVFSLINEYNVAGATMLKAGPSYFRNCFENLSQLRHMYSMEALSGLFAGKPAVLVAAGPSLDEDIHRLKGVRKKCVLICVDSALPVLLSEGIVPDFVTVLDFQLLNFEKVAPLSGKELPLSLLMVPKACPLVAKRLKPRRLILGFNEDASQRWLLDLYGIKRLLPHASSVAHLSLGLALIMGCDPIIFLGQDLAFTSEVSDHAAGTVIHWPGIKGPRRDDLWVQGVRGTRVITSRGFLPIKDLLEEIISKHKRHYVNASARGASILGTEEMRFESACSRFLAEDIDVEGEIQEVLRSHRGFDVRRLTRKVAKIRQEIKDATSLIDSAIGMASSIKDGLGSNGRAGSEGFQQQVAELSMLNERINEFTGLWDMVADLTFRIQVENDLEQRKNKGILRQNGYEPWVKAEVERLMRSQAGRRDALAELDARLAGLVEHLELEEEYLRNQHGVSSKRALARLYVDSGDFALASDLLADLGQGKEGRWEDLVLIGATNAALLKDAQEIRGPWREAVELSAGCSESVERLAEELARPWLLLLKEFPNIQELASKWLSRVGALLEFAPRLGEEIRGLWGERSREIGEMIAVGGGDEAFVELENWTPVAAVLPGDYWYLKARILYGKGSSKEASRLADRALSLGERDPQVLLFFARAFLESGSFEKGIHLLDQAVSIDPGAAVLWDEIGDVLASQGDFQGAACAYERCVLALPDRIETLKKLGQAYQKSGDLEAARAILELAVQRARGLGPEGM